MYLITRKNIRDRNKRTSQIHKAFRYGFKPIDTNEINEYKK